MEQNHKPNKLSKQDQKVDNKTDPQIKELYDSGGDSSAIEDPEQLAQANPGQLNPAHNTPGQARKDQPGQQDPGHPGQDQTQSYPGIQGPKARELGEDLIIDKKNS